MNQENKMIYCLLRQAQKSVLRAQEDLIEAGTQLSEGTSDQNNALAESLEHMSNSLHLAILELDDLIPEDLSSEEALSAEMKPSLLAEISSFPRITAEKLSDLIPDHPMEKLTSFVPDHPVEKLASLVSDHPVEKLTNLVPDTAAERISELLPDRDKAAVYSDLDHIPRGKASQKITPGALILEGGAFRGLYTQGVLDALMEADINFQTTTGISAGALSALGYVAGEIGWSARLNLSLRHDPNYIGLDAMRRDHGITGFSYIFEDQLKEHPISLHRLNDPRRRLLVGATDMNTGLVHFFEKGRCRDFFRAARASATVPYVSRPVVIDQIPYLDGGMVCNIPYQWALDEGYDKIVIVKTRDHSYRKPTVGAFRQQRINHLYYHNYPLLLNALSHSTENYNALLDRIDRDEKEGKVFVFSPRDPVEVNRFESDMDKLGDLYWKGYHEAKEAIPALRVYLAK